MRLVGFFYSKGVGDMAIIPAPPTIFGRAWLYIFQGEKFMRKREHVGLDCLGAPIRRRAACKILN